MEVVRKFDEQQGYNKVTMKSDSGPAILALKEAARREASVEIVMEEAPAGDHQANGVAENVVKNAQAQFRVLKGELEGRINKRVEGDHQAVPWMMMHTAAVISKGGRTTRGSRRAGGGKGRSSRGQWRSLGSA